MKKRYHQFFILIALLFSSCQKNIIEIADSSTNNRSDRPLLSEQFKYLEIKKPDPVLIGNSLTWEDMLDDRKLAAVTNLRDSIWANGIGKTSFYESDEMIVTPANLSYIYPGSILQAASIASDEFKTFFGYKRAPISVQLSFPSSLSIGTIESPSLSGSRIFLRDALMAPDFSGKNIDDFSQSISSFSNYNEVKLAYGYNVNEKRIFSSTNSSFNGSSSNTQYSTKLVASYTVKNFTYTMSDPLDGELIHMTTITPGIFDSISPVYVNSITYGRFGLLIVETNNSNEQMKQVFEKVVKKIFKTTTESFSQEELSLFSSCRVTIYLLGSKVGESTTQLLINPDPESFTGFISENVGTFSAEDPGVPISFTAKYLKDNSLYKTTFKLNFPR